MLPECFLALLAAPAMRFFFGLPSPIRGNPVIQKIVWGEDLGR